jgi:hypothetical protein
MKTWARFRYATALNNLSEKAKRTRPQDPPFHDQ